MKTLTLMRHAKSDWPLPQPGKAAIPDKHRPLSDRGLRDAPRMAAWLAENGIRPDIVYCSTAVRTQQTLGLVEPAINRAGVRIERRDDFYLAEAEDLLEAIAVTGAGANHIMVIGHDPGLHDLAMQLIGSGDPALRRALSAKLPTAGVVVIDFDVVRWASFEPHTGALRAFMAPKRLQTGRA